MEIVAIVDDLLSSSKITGSLQPHGHKVRVLGSPIAALDYIRASKPGLVIIDLGINLGNPFEVIRSIKRRSDLPILAYTNHTDKDGIEKAKSLGCDKVEPRSNFFDKMLLLVEEFPQ